MDAVWWLIPVDKLRCLKVEPSDPHTNRSLPSHVAMPDQCRFSWEICSGACRIRERAGIVDWQRDQLY